MNKLLYLIVLHKKIFMSYFISSKAKASAPKKVEKKTKMQQQQKKNLCLDILSPNISMQLTSARTITQSNAFNPSSKSRRSYSAVARLKRNYSNNKSKLSQTEKDVGLDQFNFSLDLNKYKEQQKGKKSVVTSTDLDNKLRKFQQDFYKKEVNACKCLTISPWNKKTQNPIIKREQNMFQFYMKQIKRKRQQKSTQRQNSINKQTIYPIFIQTCPKSYEEFSPERLIRMEEIYRKWKRANSIIVSGRGISKSKLEQGEKQAQKEKPSRISIQKKGKTNGKNRLVEREEEIQIKGWQGQQRNYENEYEHIF